MDWLLAQITEAAFDTGKLLQTINGLGSVGGFIVVFVLMAKQYAQQREADARREEAMAKQYAQQREAEAAREEAMRAAEDKRGDALANLLQTALGQASSVMTSAVQVSDNLKSTASVIGEAARMIRDAADELESTRRKGAGG